jgi:hypothetical protein
MSKTDPTDAATDVPPLAPAVGAQVDQGVRHADPKRGSVALWGHMTIAHAWAAACYVRPGWVPAAMSMASILLAALILYEDKIKAVIAARADDEQD